MDIVRRAALAFLHGEDPDDLSLSDLADALGVDRADVAALGELPALTLTPGR